MQLQSDGQYLVTYKKEWFTKEVMPKLDIYMIQKMEIQGEGFLVEWKQEILRPKKKDVDEFFENQCMKCEGYHTKSAMMLCDGKIGRKQCTAACHKACHDPVRAEDDESDWFCPRCLASKL